MRLDLPDGAWADIRDPKKITRGARKPVRSASLRLAKLREDAGVTDGEVHVPTVEEQDLLDQMQEALTVALVSAWSFDLPISAESLDELPNDAADELLEHCFEKVGEVFLNTDVSPDEESPTTPSSA